jgi:hypothetical protein
MLSGSWIASAVATLAVIALAAAAVHPTRVLPIVNALFFGRTDLSVTPLARLGYVGTAVAAVGFVIVAVRSDHDELGRVVERCCSPKRM